MPGISLADLRAAEPTAPTQQPEAAAE